MAGGGDGMGSFFGNGETAEGENAGEPRPKDTEASTQQTSVPEDSKIPDGATPILSIDLSSPSLGESYIHNETVYRPDVKELLARDFSLPSDTDRPTVLILHTHTRESYLPMGTKYITEPAGNLTYSDDGKLGVLAVGEVLCQTLNKKGITAIHCTVMHDDPTLSGSYERSAETVKRYLEEYPEISLVIDLHRDAVMTSDGELVRSLGTVNGEEVAQVMAVIGTDGNGTDFDGWEENLSLALRLRQYLNRGEANVCRPVSLRNASYYQELAPRSLLLEIGTSANTLEEAKRAATLVGEAIAALLQA